MKGLYNTRESLIRMHADTCNMLKAANGRDSVLVTPTEAADAEREQGFKIVYCKCLRAEPRKRKLALPEFIPGVTGHVPAVKLGRCANGAERDRGRLVHALIGSFTDGVAYGTAVCGAAVGPRCAGWECVNPLTQYTCPKCTARLRAAFRRNQE